MSTAQTPAPAPTIANPATKPANPRKLFMNIPVADVQRSITFFEALGFSFNAQFTDATATCMLVGEDAYVMLLDKQRFSGFSKRPVGDPTKDPYLSVSFSVGSRAEVDELASKAVAAGGRKAAEPEDHGFMYRWAFTDRDGYDWEAFWMDPSFVQG